MSNYFDNSATEAWLSAKWGNFGASNISTLTVKGNNEMFGAGAKTLIKKVARQSYTLFNMDDKIETHDMRMGKAKEAESFSFYKRLLGNLPHIKHCGDSNPIFKKYKGMDAGCSPDSITPLVNDPEKLCFGGEFKNPSGDVYMDYLFEIQDQSDLLRIKPEYYAQCQFSMMCYDVDMWHWAAYNEYFPFEERMLLIEVKYDKRYCDDLDIRVRQAVKMKNKIVEMRMNGYKGEINFKTLLAA